MEALGPVGAAHVLTSVAAVLFPHTPAIPLTLNSTTSNNSHHSVLPTQPTTQTHTRTYKHSTTNAHSPQTQLNTRNTSQQLSLSSTQQHNRQLTMRANALGKACTMARVRVVCDAHRQRVHNSSSKSRSKSSSNHVFSSTHSALPPRILRTHSALPPRIMRSASKATRHLLVRCQSLGAVAGVCVCVRVHVCVFICVCLHIFM